MHGVVGVLHLDHPLRAVVGLLGLRACRARHHRDSANSVSETLANRACRNTAITFGRAFHELG